MTPPPAPPIVEPPSKFVLIWGVDDGPSHLERIERTFNMIAAPEVVVETWLDGRKAAEVYARRLDIADFAGLPRVIFMDYFLGDGSTGVEIGGQMLEAYRRRPPHAKKAPRPILIGPSSVPDCSALIAHLGKSFSLEKRSGELVSAAIFGAFDTAEKRAFLFKHGKPQRLAE